MSDEKIDGKLLYFSMCDYGPRTADHFEKRFEVSAGFKCSSRDDRFPERHNTREQALEAMEEELWTILMKVRRELKKIRKSRFRETDRKYAIIASKAKKKEAQP